MTTVQTARYSPDTATRRGLAWRAAIIVIAAVSVALELPALVRAPLSILAVVVTALFVFPRIARRGPLDRLLMIVGATIVLLLLLGPVLNVLPTGLDVRGWGIGVGVIELAVIVGFAFVRPPVTAGSSRVRRIPIEGIAWGVIIAVVLLNALVISVNSFTTTHQAPLALAGVRSGDSVTVTVSSGNAAGIYDLVRVTSTGHSVLASGIEVAAGSSRSITIKVDANTRETIELVKPGTLTSLRELTIDTRTPASGANR